MRFWPRLAVMAALLTACGSKGPGTPGHEYPPYTGHPAELFDDGIDPAAVSYSMDPGPPPATDAKLRERVQTGDAVVRARVVTVTAKKEETGRSWQLGFHLLQRLAGTGPVDPDFTLDVDSTDPGAGMVKAFEGRLVGTTVVACVRTFARPGAPGESDVHFHLSADRPDVLKAINESALLQQVR